MNFLVDMNWHNGELVRQYTLLLDPAGFAQRSLPAVVTVPAATVSASAPAPGPAREMALASSAPASRSASAAPAAQNESSAPRALRKTTHVKVGAKATLRGIAWRVGERSESDLQRMMIAIFRANPNAFDGNINRLRLGAVLTIPQQAELSAISKAEASREFHAQMAAWRSPVQPGAVHETVAPSDPRPPAGGLRGAASTPATLPAAAAVAVPMTEDTGPATEPRASRSESEALDRRVQSLEQELNDMKGLLQTKHEQVLALQDEARSDAPAADPKPVPDTASQQSNSSYMAMSIVTGLGVLASALAALYFRLRRRPAPPRVSLTEGPPARFEPAFGDAGLDQPALVHASPETRTVTPAPAPRRRSLPGSVLPTPRHRPMCRRSGSRRSTIRRSPFCPWYRSSRRRDAPRRPIPRSICGLTPSIFVSTPPASTTTWSIWT